MLISIKPTDTKEDYLFKFFEMMKMHDKHQDEIFKIINRFERDEEQFNESLIHIDAFLQLWKEIDQSVIASNNIKSEMD